MADLGIIFLRRRYPIHWYQSSYIFITGSMPFRYFWATLYKVNGKQINAQLKDGEFNLNNYLMNPIGKCFVMF